MQRPPRQQTGTANCDRAPGPTTGTMAHSVTAPDAAAESLLRLVAEAGGVQHLNVTIDATSSDVRFTAADGTPAFGAATACRWLASLGGAATQLLGETPEQAAKVRGRPAQLALTAAGSDRRRWNGGSAATAQTACPVPLPAKPNSLLRRLPSGSASATRCSR